MFRIFTKISTYHLKISKKSSAKLVATLTIATVYKVANTAILEYSHLSEFHTIFTSSADFLNLTTCMKIT